MEIQELLKAKTLDPNIKDSHGRTAVMLARDPKITQALVDDPRTDLDVKVGGKTILEMAKERVRYGATVDLENRRDVAKMLLEESEKCRISQMQGHGLRGDTKGKVTSPEDVGLFIPEHGDEKPVDQMLPFSNNHNQINDLNRLGFAQLALVLTVAAVFVRYLVGKFSPSKNPKAKEVKRVDESVKGKEEDKSL